MWEKDCKRSGRGNIEVVSSHGLGVRMERTWKAVWEKDCEGMEDGSSQYSWVGTYSVLCNVLRQCMETCVELNHLQ